MGLAANSGPYAVESCWTPGTACVARALRPRKRDGWVTIHVAVRIAAAVMMSRCECGMPPGSQTEAAPTGHFAGPLSSIRQRRGAEVRVPLQPGQPGLLVPRVEVNRRQGTIEHFVGALAKNQEAGQVCA